MKEYKFRRGLPNFYNALEDILKRFDLTKEELKKEAKELTSNPYKGTPTSNHLEIQKNKNENPRS